ncbi:MAG: hypothetical protein IJN50_00010 [Clostridia bacterium]|nr:hypothetical protein [Clostridia bacterium]
MKKQSGITLVALIITIIVMLILVAVTLMIALGENGIISKSKEASMETEKQAIYEVIVSAMVMKKNGDIDVSGTYGAAKHLLVEKDNKVVTPVSPTSEDQITDGIGMVILDVKGNFGTYTYTITKEKIIIGRGEIGDDKLTISGATSYPYSLRIEPKEDMFTENEASAIVASVMLGDNSVTNLEELLVAIFKYSTESTDESIDYNFVKEYLEDELQTTISTPQEALEKAMPLLGLDYKTVQEWALDIYEADEKKLMVNGEEATAGVAWDGNTAIYTIQNDGNYEFELIIDGNSVNKVKVSGSDIGYEADLKGIGEALIGMTMTEWMEFFNSGFPNNPETEFDESQLTIYTNVDDQYGTGVKCNNNIYGIYMEYVGSEIYITRVDLLQ